jgi:hypothetical protein
MADTIRITAALRIKSPPDVCASSIATSIIRFGTTPAFDRILRGGEAGFGTHG